MNQQASGKGSLIRVVILLILLALVGYSFYNDISNKGPASDEAALRIMDLSDGPGVTSADVEKAAGFKAQRTFNIEKFKVEEYRYSRTIPFFKLRSVYAIYDGDQLFKVIDTTDGKELTLDTIMGKNSGLTVDFKQPAGPLPVPAMGGGAPVGDGKKDNQQKSDAPANKKDEEKGKGDEVSDAKANNSEKKSDVAPPEKPEEKKSEETSSDKKDDGANTDQGNGG